MSKARIDIDTQEVQAKAAAAAQWCEHASNYAQKVGSKLWKYLLIPHDEVIEAQRLSSFMQFEIRTQT